MGGHDTISVIHGGRGQHNQRRRLGMKLALAILAALVLSVTGSFVKAEQPDAARRALAEQLLNEMHMKENIEKSFSMMKQMMPKIMKSQMESMKSTMPSGEKGPDVKDQAEKLHPVMDKMMDEMSKEMSWENIKDDYIDLYAEMFTADELKGLVEFYKTPAGQAFVTKQPEVMQRSMEIGQKRVMQWMPKMQEMMQAAMQKSADKKDSPKSEKNAAPAKPAEKK
jgi:hypothetical protein